MFPADPDREAGAQRGTREKRIWKDTQAEVSKLPVWKQEAEEERECVTICIHRENRCQS